MEVADIYTDFNKTLLAFIKGKVRNKQDAEDILHNVFIKITLNISSLSSKEKLQNWLFKITKNSIIDFYRSRTGKSSELLDSDLVDFTELEDHNRIVDEMERCLKPLINQLPEKYRGIILDAELNGARQKDLSAKYNIPYPSLRSRVQRGRNKLKDLFLDCCKIDLDTRGGVLSMTGKNGCENNCGPC